MGPRSIPFLRILVPYLAGAVCVLCGLSLPWLHLLFLCSLLMLVIVFLLQQRLRGRLPFVARGFTAAAGACLFLLAFESAWLYDARNDPNHYSRYVAPGEQALFCTVSDMPVPTAKYLKLQVDIQAIEGQERWHCVKGRLLLYLRGAGQDAALHTGSHLYLSARLSAFHPPQNPGEFDYKRLMIQRNVFHAVYAERKEVVLLGSDPGGWSLNSLGIGIKEQVVAVLRDAGLSQEAFSICTALLVGYDDEISGDVMQSFSHSGTLHILSVSGMHTGILYMSLLFLFGLFDKAQRYRKLRCLLVIVALLLFVAVTGFSPSVLRAALMLTLVLLGKTFSRHSDPYNTLLFSAFLLLLYDPYLLADVGFLLSYLAVCGIMYLYPLLDRRWQVENRFLKFCRDLSFMSVAATVFTLPVSLYFFHQFPLWFLLSNLVIIPLSVGLMAGAFLLLLLHRVLFLKQALAWLINLITALMLRTARLTDVPGYGFIDNIPFGTADLVFCSILILLLLWLAATKSYRVAASVLLCLILWAGASLALGWQQDRETELLVFGVRNKHASLLRKGHTVYLHAVELDEKERSKVLKPYLLRFSGLRLVSDSSELWQSGQTLILHPRKEALLPAAAGAYLIVSHNVPPGLEKLQQFKPLVIVDCSNSYTFVRKLKKQCARLGLPFYSVREQGALQVSL